MPSLFVCHLPARGPAVFQVSPNVFSVFFGHALVVIKLTPWRLKEETVYEGVCLQRVQR